MEKEGVMDCPGCMLNGTTTPIITCHPQNRQVSVNHVCALNICMLANLCKAAVEKEDQYASFPYASLLIHDLRDVGSATGHAFALLSLFHRAELFYDNMQNCGDQVLISFFFKTKFKESNRWKYDEISKTLFLNGPSNFKFIFWVGWYKTWNIETLHLTNPCSNQVFKKEEVDAICQKLYAEKTDRRIKKLELIYDTGAPTRISTVTALLRFFLPHLQHFVCCVENYRPILEHVMEISKDVKWQSLLSIVLKCNEANQYSSNNVLDLTSRQIEEFKHAFPRLIHFEHNGGSIPSYSSIQLYPVVKLIPDQNTAIHDHLVLNRYLSRLTAVVYLSAHQQLGNWDMARTVTETFRRVWLESSGKIAVPAHYIYPVGTYPLDADTFKHLKKYWTETNAIPDTVKERKSANEKKRAIRAENCKQISAELEEQRAEYDQKVVGKRKRLYNKLEKLTQKLDAEKRALDALNLENDDVNHHVRVEQRARTAYMETFVREMFPKECTDERLNFQINLI